MAERLVGGIMKSYLTHLECTYCLATFSADEPHRLCVLLVPARGWHAGLRETATGGRQRPPRKWAAPFSAPGKSIAGDDKRCTYVAGAFWPAVRALLFGSQKISTAAHNKLSSAIAQPGAVG